MPAARFDIAKADFSSVAAATASLRKMNLADKQVGPVLTAAFNQSRDHAIRLTKAVLGSDNADSLSKALVAFVGGLAVKEGELRRVVAQSFREQNRELVLVQRISELPADHAKAFVADVFASGGTIQPFVQWLELAGKTIRERTRTGPAKRSRGRAKSATTTKRARGMLGDVLDAFSDAGDKLVGMVKTVADAVVDGSKLLSEAIKDVANKAVAEITDFLAALLHAGRSLASILGEAAKQGAVTLKKFVQAALEAGRPLSDIVEWTLKQSDATAKSVLQALIELGRRLSEIIGEAARRSGVAARTVARLLSEIGQTAGAVLGGAATQTVAMLQNVLQGTIGANRSLRDILAAAANMTTDLARKTVQGLLNIGRKVSEILAAIAEEAPSVSREIVAALLAAGRKAAEILQFAGTQAREFCRNLVAGLMRAGSTAEQLLIEGWRGAKTGFVALMRALLDLGEKVGSVLAVVAAIGAEAARTAVEGLIKIGIRLADVLAGVMSDVAEASRRGFVEALLALGKAPLDLLKAGAEAGFSTLMLTVAVLFEIWGGYRGLTDRERAEAEKIFSGSIDLARVRIAAGNVPSEISNFLNSQTPFTTMHLINVAKKDAQRTDEKWLRVFIREMTHVWQGVTAGPVHMIQSIGSQMEAVLAGGNRDAAYGYFGEALAKNGGNLSKFGREQQASIVEDFWVVTRSKLPKTGLPTSEQLAPYAANVSKPLRTRGNRTAASDGGHSMAARRPGSGKRAASIGDAISAAVRVRETN